MISSISYDIGMDADNKATIALANAKPYKPSYPYTVGDLCIYNNKVYMANTSYTSGTTGFDFRKWNLIGETNNITFVSTLPIFTDIIPEMIYVLTTDYSINMHDGTNWHNLYGNIGNVVLSSDEW